MFKSRQHLVEFFPRLLEHSTLYFSAREVLSFLGRKWHGKFEGEVVTEARDQTDRRDARAQHERQGNEDHAGRDQITC